jgi:hypothetical protein
MHNALSFVFASLVLYELAEKITLILTESGIVCDVTVFDVRVDLILTAIKANSPHASYAEGKIGLSAIRSYV